LALFRHLGDDRVWHLKCLKERTDSPSPLPYARRRAGYKKHCLAYLEGYEPADCLDADLSASRLQWLAPEARRPNRKRHRLEQANVAFAHAYAWLERGKIINLSSFDERRIQRAFQDDLALLEKLLRLRVFA
jgi:hypothetical protein